MSSINFQTSSNLRSERFKVSFYLFFFFLIFFLLIIIENLFIHLTYLYIYPLKTTQIDCIKGYTHAWLIWLLTAVWFKNFGTLVLNTPRPICGTFACVSFHYESVDRI